MCEAFLREALLGALTGEILANGAVDLLPLVVARKIGLRQGNIERPSYIRDWPCQIALPVGGRHVRSGERNPVPRRI